MNREARRLIRELAAAVVGDREDAVLMRPLLMRTLTVEVNDFLRYFDPAHAKSVMRDHAILLADPIAKRHRPVKSESA